jgi:sporulation protein YlmC with PRC-barrel domain
VSKSAALALAMIIGATPVAFAQTAAPATPAHPAKATTSTSFATPSGQLRANKIIGSTVYDRQNQNIGSVKDIVLDENGGAPNVVVDVGAFLGMGGKYVSMPLGEFKTDNDRLTVDRTKEQLKTAPAYNLASDQKS